MLDYPPLTPAWKLVITKMILHLDGGEPRLSTQTIMHRNTSERIEQNAIAHFGAMDYLPQENRYPHKQWLFAKDDRCPDCGQPVEVHISILAFPAPAIADFFHLN